jgi:SAM-dependent methyltransferase
VPHLYAKHETSIAKASPGVKIPARHLALDLGVIEEMKSVQEFYNRFPYPAISSLALPRSGQGARIAYETGASFAGNPSADHRGKRILVAGAGTFEAVVIAQQHPRAQEVIALDLSQSSLDRLKKRLRLAKIRTVFPGLGLFNRIAPVHTHCADILDFDEGTFDYITATLVLHHHEDPLGLLTRLESMLKPGGLIRLTTYPKHSRFWPRQIGKWLTLGGIDRAHPRLKEACDARIEELPDNHPLRVSYTDNPESRTATGLADCYLHPCENPLAPMTWCKVTEALGLNLVGESQHPYAQSTFLDELAPALNDLSSWQKLQVLDDLLELSSNPVLWLHKGEARQPPSESTAPTLRDDTVAPPGSGVAMCKGLAVEDILEMLDTKPDTRFWIPSGPQFELAEASRRTLPLLQKAGLSLTDLLARITEEVGPRVSIRSREVQLKGLTLPELLHEEALQIPEPPDAAIWHELASTQASLSLRLVDRPNKALPGQSIADQAQHLQLTQGHQCSWIGPLVLKASS